MLTQHTAASKAASPNGSRGSAFKSCTTRSASRGLRSSSTRFIPSPVTDPYATSAGRWLTHDDIKSSTRPPAGSHRRYIPVTAAMAPSSMCVTSRGEA